MASKQNSQDFNYVKPQDWIKGKSGLDFKKGWIKTCWIQILSYKFNVLAFEFLDNLHFKSPQY